MVRSTVIKAESARPLRGSVVKPFTFDDLTREASDVLARARDEAERLVAGARREAEAIRKQAWEEGYRVGRGEGEHTGRKAGRAAAMEEASRSFEEQHRHLVASCEGLISAIEADRAAWQASARQDLVDLAMAIARKVAHVVGQRERQAVLENLEEVIRIAGARSDVTLFISPEDESAARSFARSLVDMREQWKHVRVVAEAEIEPGGCRVQWGSGAVDAGLGTQLDRIAAELGVRWDAGQEERADES